MKHVIFVFAIVCMAGCSQRKVDLEAEKAKIEFIWSDWPKKAKTMEPDNYVYYFADDVTLSTPGQPPFKSKADIKKMFASMPRIPGFEDVWEDTVNIIGMSASGDVAYSFDKNEMHIPDSTGKIMIQKNYGLHVWKKNDQGEWRVAAMMITPRNE